MQVKLKVIGGRNDGREIKISVPEFIIGRGDDAHLKPNSDLISRRHCLLKIKNGTLVISDMGSRNGTYVNGTKLQGKHVAKIGDTLRVGRLQFEVLIDHVQPGNKKPKVAGVAEAAARVSKGKQAKFDEENITDWLSAQDEDQEAMSETVHFSLEETPTKMFVRSDEMESEDDESEEGPESGEKVKESGSKRHKKYKKLPPKEVAKAESSKSAADDVLKRFFNRR